MNRRDEWLREFILEYLEQVNYWHARFEISGDVDYLDNCERFAEVAKEDLPKGLRELSIIGLKNLFWNLSATTGSTELGGTHDKQQYRRK